jgi:1,4-alpha-glucan branching enzyme
MVQNYLAVFFTLTAGLVTAQVSLTPTITPSIFSPGDQITVTYDVTSTSLSTLTNAYIWVWIPSQNIDAKYNVNPASNNPALTNNAKFIKSTVNGHTLFTLSFTPSDVFATSITSATSMGMLLKGNDWTNGQTTDFVTDFWDGSYTLKLNSPLNRPLFTAQNNVVSFQAETPVNSTFKLFIDDVLIDEATGSSIYTYDHTFTQSSGTGMVRLESAAATSSAEVEFQYIISVNSPIIVRPEGVIPGINYGVDNTKAILCLWAPEKSSVYIRGDFTDWKIKPEYLMNKDGEFFWLELSGLTPGTEYAFQYLVDEILFLADPYSDKILDPDDQNIPETSYPNLKDFPEEAKSASWYFNRVSVLETGQIPYAWQTENYERPNKENLVVYELLIRDFFDHDDRTYQNLTDTIGYFKRLGVNAIQLMPIMEFNGNESWGYNPTFMFAPDKYYGHKNKLKEFIDHCHAEDIAVILDIAMNHQDLPNPYVLMDYDFDAKKPKATNKWFHEKARHPFNVFFDMNHSSAYTKAYLDTVNYYWLNEYRVDGFRFDLSKGFSSVNYCTTPNCDTESEVSAWSERDQSRIDNLTRMADAIWEHTPDAIIILEHLSVNTEEKELAEYRAGEGKGMLLWGNMNYNYNRATMGFESGSDISKTSYQARGWLAPHLVSYMESHDEERLAYRNKQSGNVLGSYSVKELQNSMDRIKAASVLFYSIPGPKMIWQFGEFGYDYSINTCTDGTVGDCRVAPKPIRWDYLDDPERISLFLLTADLIKLHTEYSVFTDGTATIPGGTSLVKQVQIKNNPYKETPTTTDEMNVLSVANLEMTQLTVTVTFPHTGTWYDYYNGGQAIVVSNASQSFLMKRGEYRIFTDVSIGPGPVTANETITSERTIQAYPNPTDGRFTVAIGAFTTLRLLDLRGMEHSITRDGDYIDISTLPSGMYILLLNEFDQQKRAIKIVKK